MKTTRERGESHHSAKLTKDDVLWIRLNGKQLSLRAMARRFNVSHVAVANVLNGVSWKHVAYEQGMEVRHLTESKNTLNL